MQNQHSRPFVTSDGRLDAVSWQGCVVVHAHGFEVDCVVPGGDPLRLNGTSMASPQVANLAAKLLALKSELSAVQVKALIIDGADRPAASDGRPGCLNLVNSRRRAALAGIAI